MRVVVILVVLIAGIGFASYAYANYQLSDRVTELARGARGLCGPNRNGKPPDEEQLHERFLSLADTLRLLVQDLRIELEPLTSKHGVHGQLQAQLAQSSGGKLLVTATVITFSARVSGKKWLWSTEQDIAPSCTFQGAIVSAPVGEDGP